MNPEEMVFGFTAPVRVRHAIKRRHPTARIMSCDFNGQKLYLMLYNILCAGTLAIYLNHGAIPKILRRVSGCNFTARQRFRPQDKKTQIIVLFYSDKRAVSAAARRRKKRRNGGRRADGALSYRVAAVCQATATSARDPPSRNRKPCFRYY